MSGGQEVATRPEMSPLTAVVTPAPTATAAPSPEPTPPAATGPTDTSAPTDQPDARATRQRALVVTATILVLVGGGVSVVGALRSQHTAPTSVATSTTSTTATVAAWLRGNVATTATVASDDPALTADLATRGLDVTGVATVGAAPVGSFVVTAARYDDAPVAVATGRTFVPVARFAGGSTALEVGQVVANGADTVTRNRSAALATARAATAGLLDNAAVTVDADARSTFDLGTLDLRAAAFVAALAGTQSVRVAAVPTDAAEVAVGLPARRLVVSVADPDALRTTVGRTRDPYAPVVAAAPAGVGPAGSVLLTWSVLADPSLVVS